MMDFGNNVESDTEDRKYNNFSDGVFYNVDQMVQILGPTLNDIRHAGEKIFSDNVSLKNIDFYNIGGRFIDFTKATKSMVAANKATDEKFPLNKAHHNNLADAYRHAYWSADMTKQIGGELAKSIGLNHEAGFTQKEDELNMDLWNNDIGIKLASDLRNTDLDTADILTIALDNDLLQKDPTSQQVKDSVNNWIKFAKKEGY